MMVLQCQSLELTRKFLNLCFLVPNFLFSCLMVLLELDVLQLDVAVNGHESRDLVL
jgi:hypothetical protein